MACNKDLEMIVQYVGVIVQYTKALADHSDTVNICMCDDIFMLFFFVELLFATRELCQYKKGGPKAAPKPTHCGSDYVSANEAGFELDAGGFAKGLNGAAEGHGACVETAIP